MSVSTRAQTRKRQRTGSDEPSGSPTKPAPVEDPDLNVRVQRHDDLWFEDGNIVLVAPDGIGFRVYRGTLSRCSDVFRDMFSLPQSSEGDIESFDGCPIVRLQDRSADLTHLLSVLYDVGKSSFFNETTASFGLVSAALRLGTKYQIESLRSKALSRLEKCFPGSFSQWDPNLHRGDDATIELQLVDAICVVNLARSLDLPSLLPCALYVCTQLPSDVLVDGVIGSDSTSQRLSPADLKLCLNARESLIRCTIDVTAALVDESMSAICLSKDDCPYAIRVLIQKVHRNGKLTGHNPLTSRMPNLKNANRLVTPPLCQNCLKNLTNLEKKAQANVWAGFKDIFYLS